MSANTLAIPFAYILLASVLCLVLIGTKWKWWIKLILFMIVLGASLVIWNALDSYKGWPTTSALPEKAEFLWGVVYEPEPAHGFQGEIDIWLRPAPGQDNDGLNPLRYAPSHGEPRAHRLPYSRPLHEAVEAGMNMVRHGKRVMFGRGGQGEGEEGDAEGEGGSGGGSGRPGYRYETNDFHVYELPPPRPPRKDPEDSAHP